MHALSLYVAGEGEDDKEEGGASLMETAFMKQLFKTGKVKVPVRLHVHVAVCAHVCHAGCTRGSE